MLRVACVLLVLAAAAQARAVSEEVGRHPNTAHHDGHKLTNNIPSVQKEERKQFVLRIPCGRDDHDCSRSQVYEFQLLQDKHRGSRGSTDTGGADAGTVAGRDYY